MFLCNCDGKGLDNCSKRDHCFWQIIAIIPLSHADKVTSPQVERRTWPINQDDAKSLRPERVTEEKPHENGQRPNSRNYDGRTSEAVEPMNPSKRLAKYNERKLTNRHPRNVRIIPKSRDFH
jgi:hypothetical protein